MKSDTRFWNSPIPAMGKIVPSQAPAADSIHVVEDESYSFDALMIHEWLSKLLDESIEVYLSRRNAKFMGMQSGQAQRGFLRVFGHPSDTDLQRIIHSMYRFTASEDPLAVILFRALDAVSAEHQSRDDFARARPVSGADCPPEALRWMRESMDRWFDWVDAFIHVQTHAQWHLTPECFDGDAEKREPAIQALKRRRTEEFFASRRLNWQIPLAETANYYRELPIWQVMPQVRVTRSQRPWAHPDLDDAIISLWPLVKRHHWTFPDLQTVLEDLLLERDAYPIQSERNLATYCLHSLRLRKMVQGRTSKEERPGGYIVALRLIPPMPPRPAFRSGLGDDPEAEI